MDYYGDDYYEPTLAEEIFEQAKEKLEKAMRDEIKDKILTAEKLLAEQDKKEAELRTKENKLNWRERELESKFRDIENEFAKKKLGEFMATVQKYLGQTYYQVDMYSELIPKCDGCNEDRKIEVKMPNGSITKIDCSCNKRVYKYRVLEKEMIGINIEKDGSYKKFWLIYYSDSNNVESLSPIYDVKEKFEDRENKNSSYKAFYTNKEEAQKHADYLNKLQEEKSGI